MRNNNLTSNLKLRITLLFVLGLIMMGCGASKAPSSNETTSSSRLADTLTTPDTSNTNVQRALAYCNQGSNSQLSVATSTYSDGSVIALNRINLKITKIPAYFSQNQNYLEFHKWLVNPGGSKIYGSSRMQFHIYSISDGLLLEENKSFLYWADLQRAAQTVGASTPDQFFKKVRFVIELEDYNGDYDAINLRYFNQSDNSLVSSLDSLIPVFDADPNLYAKEKDGTLRNQQLQDLHPFKTYANQGLSASTYQSMSYAFCKPVYSVQ